MTEEKEFNNYKERQRYFDEKYKNRGDIFFAQQPKAKIYADGKAGEVKKQKGRTYIKPKEEGVK